VISGAGWLQMAHLAHASAVELGEKLAGDASLVLPANLQRSLEGQHDQGLVKQYLVNLLERDSGVFLERRAPGRGRLPCGRLPAVHPPSIGLPSSARTRRLCVASTPLHSNLYPVCRVFRYGGKLSAQERGLFQGLRADYEVDFHLRVLEDAEVRRARPPADAGAALGAQARNRRWAALRRLEQGGEYFGEVRAAPAPCAACSCGVG
jgi:hypothetical protein